MIPSPSADHQLWVLVFEANDGSTGVYPFWFLPTEDLASPELDSVLQQLDLDDSEDEAGGCLERIDTPGVEFPTLK